MPHLALYRKYRSKDFDELAGQSHVIQSLENAIKRSQISHAYLFSGPHGVGKTSAARILARRINQLTLEQAENHLDIIEIDAASNRKIDEIRDLREKIHIAPTSAKYKVYIIDEVHMLTTEAFNALLKTLEEPPEHAVFILATTDMYKLPETIISRTQHFRFLPISIADASKQISAIASKEKLKLEPNVAEMIATAGRGSMRDSLSILDQLASLNQQDITADSVRDLLGWGGIATLEELTLFTAQGKLPEAIRLLKKLSNDGVSFTQLLEQMMIICTKAIHLQLGIVGSSSDIVQKLSAIASVQELSSIISKLSAIPPGSPYIEEYVESAVIDLCLQKNVPQQSSKPTISKTPFKKAPSTNHLQPIAKESAPIRKAKKPDDKSADEAWVRILSEVKKHNNSLYALLRSADPTISSDRLLVTFRFQFHKRRLEESTNINILKAAISKVLGESVYVVIAVKQPVSKTANAEGEAEQDKEAVNNVLQILGGEVVND